MPHNNFSDMNLAATMIAFVAGVWGALVSFIKRDLDDFTLAKKIPLFFMDMFVNVGLTMLAYSGLIGYGINELLAVAISGFMGHQGTRSFYLIELLIAEKIGAKETFNEVRKNKGDR